MTDQEDIHPAKQARLTTLTDVAMRLDTASSEQESANPREALVEGEASPSNRDGLPWTVEEISSIRRMREEEHLSFESIGQLLGREGSSCRTKYWKAVKNNGGLKQEWTRDEVALLKQMRRERKSMRDIAEVIQCSVADCRAKLKALTAPQHGGEWAGEEIAILFQMRGSLASWRQISEKLGRDWKSCRDKYEEICEGSHKASPLSPSEPMETLDIPQPECLGRAFTPTMTIAAYDATVGHPREERLAAMRKFREALKARYEEELKHCDHFIRALQ